MLKYTGTSIFYVLQFNLNEINALFQQTGQNMADLFIVIFKITLKIPVASGKR